MEEVATEEEVFQRNHFTDVRGEGKIFECFQGFVVID
uniref:Uncharacterized protein n=1 Tax=Anguilla anguilla TaxID=7936 RepID=A0A0E9T002_ANGAN